jgi:hypothetical protein
MPPTGVLVGSEQFVRSIQQVLKSPPACVGEVAKHASCGSKKIAYVRTQPLLRLSSSPSNRRISYLPVAAFIVK